MNGLIEVLSRACIVISLWINTYHLHGCTELFTQAYEMSQLSALRLEQDIRTNPTVLDNSCHFALK